jgi:GNAT superfamily N-acetyltransferase
MKKRRVPWQSPVGLADCRSSLRLQRQGDLVYEKSFGWPKLLRTKSSQKPCRAQDAGHCGSGALINAASGASRTFVTTSEYRVVGYYALAAGAVERASASGNVRRNQPQMVPIIVVGRLAVDRNHQGRGVGSHLLREPSSVQCGSPTSSGVRAILVHALNDEARQFYLRYDFEPSPTDHLQLFLLIKDAQELLDRITPR